MANDNAVTIIGTVTRDPGLRFMPSGSEVANFGIARNTRVKNGDTWEDGPAQFYDVKCWGSLAKNICDSIAKGTRVVVFGELEYRTWETDGGDKRSKVEIKAESIGPDLRWATASVTKNERGTGGGSATSGGETSKPPVENPYA